MKRALGLIGLCMRAGRISLGAPNAEKAIRSGTAKLVLLDGGASANTRKAVADACSYRKVPLETLPPDLLGSAVGRPGRMCAAVTDEGFAEQIQKRLREAGKSITD